MKRILIDLTDIEKWSGHHGGIQRVVYGIAKNYYLRQDKLGYEVRFIVFSDPSKTFHFTTFEPIYERAEAFKTSQSSAAAPTTVSLKEKLKDYARRYVPESIRANESARSIAKKSFKFAAGSLRRAKKMVKNVRVPQADETVTFQSSDTVLILGKPWDDLNIQRTLSREKARTGFKLVQVVYDLIISLYPHLHHPTLFEPYTRHMFEAISSSDLMLPISKASARDLRKFCSLLNLEVPQHKVIRLGDDIVATLDEADIQKPDVRIEKKFILCVGTVEIRKNHALLYYTYKLATEQGIELPQLLIIGGKGWLTADLQYLIEHDPAIKNKIIMLNNVSDSGLQWAYKNCLFTVYPSMYEGWGLPVAESLAYGKLCISSNASSMPEIGGELLEYFSPYSAQQCLDAIAKCQEPKVLLQKETAIAKHYKPVTWEESFERVERTISELSTK